MDCSMSVFPVHHQLPEFTQTHVHWVGDAIQPFHPLSSPSPPTFNLFQHLGLFQWVSSLHQVAKVLEFQLQHQSSKEYSGFTESNLLDGLESISRVFSNTIVQKHQFFASGGQSIGVSASTSVLPMNIQDWFPLGWTGRISLQYKGLPRVFSNTTVRKHHYTEWSKPER